jgi:hypothetical protein
VDEHWVCGIHRSSSSSRTGEAHLRALHKLGSGVQTFCGAGRSAFFLQQLYRDEQAPPPRFIVGLGFWHRDDTDALRSLFQPGASARNPYRLTPARVTLDAADAAVELVNMNDALHDAGDPRDVIEYTTRIIRIYRQTKQDRVEYDRLDWEPDSMGRRVEWTAEKRAKLSRLLEHHLAGRKVGAVIIKDMNKGVVTREIVEWLISQKRLSRARWYVSSKQWRPEWLELLRKTRLQLLMVPQVPAQEAIRGRELSCWLTRSEYPSSEALALIDELARTSGAKMLVILPDGFSALGYQPESAGAAAQFVVQAKRQPDEIKVDMGGASIVFPTLLACMEHSRHEWDSLASLLTISLRTAHEWVKGESRRIIAHEEWNPDPGEWSENSTFKKLRDIMLKKPGPGPLTIDGFGEAKPLNWARANEDWDHALREVGIIPRGNGEGDGLQLWRAMVEIDGFVCCGKKTRNSLQRLVQGVQTFARAPHHHASCMLVSSPGSGKTFLAKQLAQVADFRFLPFNITQMRSTADILECFDTIVATQAESPQKKLLVFIDEINANLHGGHVYSAFLTPLEDGTYVRNGRVFTIKPCMWIFAGTHNPRYAEEESGHEKEKAEKGSDFASRLTLDVVDLDWINSGRGGSAEDPATRGLRALENVDLGVSQLRSEFPDVRKVSELVLRAFWELSSTARARDIKHFVRRFKDVQYGRVTSANVPDGGWPGDEQGMAESQWKEWKRVGKPYSDEANIEVEGGISK